MMEGKNLIRNLTLWSKSRFIFCAFKCRFYKALNAFFKGEKNRQKSTASRLEELANMEDLMQRNSKVQCDLQELLSRRENSTEESQIDELKRIGQRSQFDIRRIKSKRRNKTWTEISQWTKC